MLTYYFAGLVVFVGIAMAVLDSVYLVKKKPTGAKKVLTIISLCLYAISLYIAGVVVIGFTHS